VRDSQVVDCVVVVEPGMALPRVERPGESEGQFPDEAVVGNAEVAQLEGEADKMGDEVWGVNAAVDEDGSVDVGVVCRRIYGRLCTNLISPSPPACRE
jgi:hypothetical protein